ncbi:hypothetical protein [Streptomyces sp. NPDC058657]|uniref:hypothetical protein n=1 Tax=unclassified Streptomyces TaxID=2593676 RepID=UPI0036641D94
MHSETPYTITTAARNPDPLAYLAPAPRAVMLPSEMPPGVQRVILPNGEHALAYVQTPTHAVPPAPPAPQPIPAWAKTVALLTPTIGGGIAAAGIGLSYAAPGLIAMTDALWAAVAFIAIGALAVPLILRCTRSRTAAPAHITQNITATGMFGRANGTINHR